MEANIQSKIIKFLKKKGCYVIKTKPGVGTPVGCPDIVFFIEGFWGAIECKARKNSPYRPLQKDTIAKLNNWSWCKVVHEDNVDAIMLELSAIL